MDTFKLSANVKVPKQNKKYVSFTTQANVNEKLKSRAGCTWRQDEYLL